MMTDKTRKNNNNSQPCPKLHFFLSFLFSDRVDFLDTTKMKMMLMCNVFFFFSSLEYTSISFVLYFVSTSFMFSFLLFFFVFALSIINLKWAYYARFRPVSWEICCEFIGRLLDLFKCNVWKYEYWCKWLHAESILCRVLLFFVITLFWPCQKQKRSYAKKEWADWAKKSMIGYVDKSHLQLISYFYFFL